jgi:hypothetical protein
MHRRWFFRITSLTLLILCLAAWGWSYVYRTTVTCMWSADQHAFQLGYGNLSFIRFLNAPYVQRGWELRSERAAPELIVRNLVGFHYSFDPSGCLRLVRVPLWFVAAILAALTWWAWRKRTWRKTRTQGDRGFAVEGAAPLREESGEKRGAGDH